MDLGMEEPPGKKERPNRIHEWIEMEKNLHENNENTHNIEWATEGMPVIKLDDERIPSSGFTFIVLLFEGCAHRNADTSTDAYLSAAVSVHFFRNGLLFSDFHSFGSLQFPFSDRFLFTK